MSANCEETAKRMPFRGHVENETPRNQPSAVDIVTPEHSSMRKSHNVMHFF